MVLDQKSNFFLGKMGFLRTNQLCPRKKMVLGQKTNFFLGRKQMVLGQKTNFFLGNIGISYQHQIVPSNQHVFHLLFVRVTN